MTVGLKDGSSMSGAATLLSLLVVPAVFTYIDDLEHLLKRGVARLRRPAPVSIANHRYAVSLTNVGAQPGQGHDRNITKVLVRAVNY
jgi:hypothetical protein